MRFCTAGRGSPHGAAWWWAVNGSPKIALDNRVVENLKKFLVPPGRKILLDFVVEKPHKFVNAEAAGPTMAADEEEEEYGRLANDPSLAGYARELSAQIT